MGEQPDIVDRLKSWSGWDERHEHMGATGQLIWDAIEEIEQLRRGTDYLGRLAAQSWWERLFR